MLTSSRHHSVQCIFVLSWTTRGDVTLVTIITCSDNLIEGATTETCNRHNVEHKMEVQSHTLDDVYRLIETLKSELSKSFRAIHDDIASLKTDVSQIKQDFQAPHREMVVLSAKTDHLDTNIHWSTEPRVESCETRIAALEDNLDDHIRDSPRVPPEEYPADTILVCSGLRADHREDITSVAQNIIDNGLGLINVNVVRPRRLVSRNQKPGLVKIQMPTTADKVAALRCKRNLMDTGYRGVYIRSSSSHTDRITVSDSGLRVRGGGRD